MPSAFHQALVDAMWPTLLPIYGETISHDPTGVTAAYDATLVFDDGDAIKAEKGNRVAALISGPTSSFTTTPAERDTFTLADGRVFLCVEVEDDLIGGWKCWCRLKSA